MIDGSNSSSANSVDSTPTPAPAACIGWDWGDSSHALGLQAAGSDAIEAFTLEATPEALHQWLDQIQERFGGRPVAFALEGTKGPAFDVLLERPWARVFGVHPATASRYRSAFTPSGAKDDRPDALLLLELVLKHPDKLRLLERLDPASRHLDELTRLRRDWVDRRTQLTNQLVSLLKKYFPQALQLIGEVLYAPLALAFLKRWPSLLELKKSRPATLRAFYHQHNVRRPEAVAQRLELIQNARWLTTDLDFIGVRTLELEGLLAQLSVLNQAIQRLDQQIQQSFQAHPERELFAGLPGAGKALAPRLAASFGTDRERFPSAQNLQCLVGVAPVMERSGKSRVITWRWQAADFLRQSFVEWARCSVGYSAWAGAYYRQKLKRGKKPWTIYRALAFKWIRILWKCWQTRTPYDEARYLQQLIRRGSPLAQSLQIDSD